MSKSNNEKAMSRKILLFIYFVNKHFACTCPSPLAQLPPKNVFCECKILISMHFKIELHASIIFVLRVIVNLSELQSRSFGFSTSQPLVHSVLAYFT